MVWSGVLFPVVRLAFAVGLVVIRVSVRCGQYNNRTTIIIALARVLDILVLVGFSASKCSATKEGLQVRSGATDMVGCSGKG